MQSLSQQLRTDKVTDSLASVIDTLSKACKDIAILLQNGAMSEILGSADEQNVQGETQKKLDVISNDILKQQLLDSADVRAIASEEEEYIVAGKTEGKYLVAFDPLDGSSNIDINSMVGTIFSIFAAPNKTDINESDFLLTGRQQAAAGYVLYGPSVMLVLTTGNGVQMYTLDQKNGEFVLTNDQVSIDRDTQEYAINMANQRHWAQPMQQYIGELQQGSDGVREKNFNMRWVAAMVADVHRILCRGGFFSYPWDNREPEKPGKLRLMYEANPMSLLVEQAGGKAFADQTAILDIQPSHIHQRVPVILGAANEVSLCVKYHTEV